MNLSSIKYYSTQNGPGFRTAIFVSGCRIHCEGCFNKVAWDFKCGKELTDEIIEKILYSCRENYISGISILGGEPLDYLNQSGVRKIIEAFRNRYGESKTIWMWTGYEKDSIPITEHTNYILKELDAAVVGPFIKDLHDPELRYAGSTNQKIVKFKELLNS